VIAAAFVLVAAALPLAGTTVAVDPGHDGANGAHPAQINRAVAAGTGGFRKACDTAGAATNDGRLSESRFTLDVAQRLRRRLEALGAHVVLTRRTDDGVGPCIDERAAIGNQAHSAAVVSIHADGGPANGRGFFVIAPSHTPGISSALYDASGLLASAIRDAVRADTAMPTATYAGSAGFERSGIYGGLNLTEVPAMFIECGNMRNAQDAALLERAAFRDSLASAIVAGIAAFVG
jgi:N-acetylmuramoyl-L-alanine amidase